MEKKYPIHDLLIETLHALDAASWRSLQAYAFDDHLLKRIGVIESIEVTEGDALPAFLRSEADELWTLLQGRALFQWIDHREGSPTLHATHSLVADAPVRVLVPFGVEFQLAAQSDCTLLRISTHAGDLGELRSETHQQKLAL